MTTPAPGMDELAAARGALDHVAALVLDGREMFDGSADRRLALAYCWVNIGSQLKQFARKTNLPRGTVTPLSKPIKMRDKLAYGPLPLLRTDIVWDTSVHDGPPLREFVADLLAAG